MFHIQIRVLLATGSVVNCDWHMLTKHICLQDFPDIQALNDGIPNVHEEGILMGKDAWEIWILLRMCDESVDARIFLL